MYSFFVLGLIPGTNIQITFGMWLMATTALVLSAYVLRSVWRRRQLLDRLPPTIAAESDLPAA